MDSLSILVYIFVKLLWFLMKVLAQLPFSLNIRAVKFSPSRFSYMYAIVCVIVYVAALFQMGIPMFEFQISGQILYGLSAHMSRLHYFSKVFIAIVLTILQIFKSKETVTWGNSVRELHLKIIRLPIGLESYRSDIVFFAIRTAFQITAQMLTNLLQLAYLTDLNGTVTSWVTVVLLLIPILIISAFGNKFTVIMFCLARTLSKLNVNLKNEVRKVNRWNSKNMTRMQKITVQLNASENIEKLADVHAATYKIIRQTKKLYSFRIFLTVALLFINIIAELYFTCDHLTRRSKGLSPRPTLLEVFGIIHLCLLSSDLYFIINCCQMLKDANDEARLIIHKISVLLVDQRLKMVIEELSLRVWLTDIATRPMHLFSLDSSTLYQMAHAITTYLIFLVQFKMSQDLELTKKWTERFDHRFLSYD